MASSQTCETGSATLAQVDPQMVIQRFATIYFFDGVEQLHNFGNILWGHVSLDIELDHVSQAIYRLCCVVLRLDGCQEN